MPHDTRASANAEIQRAFDHVHAASAAASEMFLPRAVRLHMSEALRHLLQAGAAAVAPSAREHQDPVAEDMRSEACEGRSATADHDPS